MTRLEIAAGVLPHYATTAKTFKDAAEGALSYADALLAAAGESIIQVSEGRLKKVLNDWFIIHENQLDDLIKQLKDGK